MRAALVGCGQAARYHLDALATVPGVELVAVCDIDPRRAAESAARAPSHCRAHTDLPALIENERPDVVHVLTPPASHAEIAIEAARAGCHVLVEKPFALSVDEADAMVAAARDNQVALVPNHNYLLKPSVLKARRMLDKGAIGEVVFVDSYYGLSRELASPPHWSYQLPGGVFTNFLPHLCYLQTEFLDTVESVAGVTTAGEQGRPGEPTELTVLLEGAAATGVMEISTRARPYAKYVRVFGTRGIVHADLASEVTTIHRERHQPRMVSKTLFNVEEAMQLMGGTAANTAKVLVRRMGNMPDLVNVLCELYEALEEGRSPPFTGEDGRTNVELMEQVWARMAAEPTAMQSASVRRPTGPPRHGRPRAPAH
jgi:predicted dehydrogenase